MGLVFRDKIRDVLTSHYQQCNKAVLITAYLTSGIFTVLEEVDISDKDISIFVRGNKKDFAAGSVCIKTLMKLHHLGVTCYLVRNLHSKIYVFDDAEMFIGSANLTNNGLSPLGSTNIEVLMSAPYNESYTGDLKRSLRYAVKVTNEILEKIQEENDSLNTLGKSEECLDWDFWSIDDFGHDLADSILPWCDISLPVNDQDKVNQYHDELLFGLKLDGSFDRALFISSALHLFLVKILSERDEGEQFLYFRDVRQLLIDYCDVHYADAKKITVNIFSYYRSRLCLPILHDQPVHSERLRLVI